MKMMKFITGCLLLGPLSSIAVFAADEVFETRLYDSGWEITLPQGSSEALFEEFLEISKDLQIPQIEAERGIEKSCVVICTSHRGFPWGMPLNQQGVTRNQARIILSNHIRQYPNHHASMLCQ